ncbi:MAG: SDR family oxidoreductase [Melioribacteraceae bacterium]|nr:MAG: SDR family oxidoreductase [Melioribacteraceae bacterium]
MNSLGDLTGKVCVLTGGCGVFGNVFATALLEAGAKLAIMDYKKGRCDQCAQNLAKKSGSPVLCVVANVLDKEGLIAAKKEVNEEFGKVDILINAAGGNAPTATTKNEFLTNENVSSLSDSFFGLDIEGFRSVFDLNFLGTVLPSMIFAEDMINRGGSILNISSMNSFKPLTKIPAYSAAKASVNNFTEWLATHFAKVGVRVNAIAPGFFVTNQNRFLLFDEKTNELSERGKKIINGTPMGRFGEPEELISTMLYLLSDSSKFVTGVVIPVDGGFNAYSGV